MPAKSPQQLYPDRVYCRVCNGLVCQRRGVMACSVCGRPDEPIPPRGGPGTSRAEPATAAARAPARAPAEPVTGKSITRKPKKGSIDAVLTEKAAVPEVVA